jgi:hypothetical protein
MPLIYDHYKEKQVFLYINTLYMLSSFSNSAFAFKYYKTILIGEVPVIGMQQFYDFESADLVGVTVKNHVTDTFDGDAIGLCSIENNQLKIINTTGTNSQFSTYYPIGPSDVTISFWIQITNVEGGYGGIMQFDNDQSVNNEITLHYNGSIKKVYFTGTGAPTNIQVTQDLSVTLHHIVMTQSVADGIEIYIDNDVKLTYNSSFNITRNYLGFGIGKTTQWGSDAFYENIRIYDRILTRTEITDLYKYDLL